MPVLGRTTAFEGTPFELEVLIRKEAQKAKAPLQQVLATTADILAAGSDTIYHPEHLVVATIFDPRQIAGEAGNLWNAIGGKVHQIVAGDVAGAIIGGIAGGAAGGATGGTTGAVQGAVKGAISGAVAGSAKAAAGV